MKRHRKDYQRKYYEEVIKPNESKVLKRKLTYCEWIKNNNRRVWGRLYYIAHKDKYNKNYVPHPRKRTPALTREEKQAIKNQVIKDIIQEENKK